MKTKFSKDPLGLDPPHTHYNILNPKYPEHFIQYILDMTMVRKKYLDIASGSGMLFYNFIPHFKDICLCNDINGNRLEIARQRATEVECRLEKPPIVDFIQCDGNNLHHALLNLHKEKKEIPFKFNLITMGQSLHLFEPTSYIAYILKYLLENDGVISVCSYFTDRIEYNYHEDPIFADRAQIHFENFSQEIKPYYKYSRDLLETKYAAIHFEKFFNRVERHETSIKTDISIEQLVNQRRKNSGYRNYVANHGKSTHFSDPMDYLVKNLTNDLQLYCHRTRKLLKEHPIRLRTTYFLINMTNKFPK